MSGFQENLREYRENAGLTARDMSKKIGVRYTTYTNYENAGSEPRYETLCKIAAVLHTSPNDLLGFEPEEKSLEYWRGYMKRE